MTSNQQLATINALIAAALAEDIGSGDITSELLIPDTTQARMRFVAREGVVVCGGFIPVEVYKQLSGEVNVQVLAEEGSLVAAGTAIAEASGPARAILTGERVALNLMQRMCGVATLTHVYVDAVKGTKAIILDTRKTMPGMRSLDKYAVRTGGGQNHRMGLYDMVLIKDNHIEIGMRHEALGIRELVEKTRAQLSSLMPQASSLMPIVVECDTLEQLSEALAANPDRILLDNMSLQSLRKAVELTAGRVKLEVSGNVSLDTVRAIAETGVDYISVGKLTHSAPAADIGADVTCHPGAGRDPAKPHGGGKNS